MRLAYLTTAYPSVSHTFIRREILELEKQGHAIDRFAIRPGSITDDADDIAEQTLTLHLLAQSRIRLLGQVLRGALLAGTRIPRALANAARLSAASERGLGRHLAYFIEALALLDLFKARRIDHVHVHFGTNAAAVAMLVRKLGGPSFSMTVHGPDEFDASIGLSLGAKMQAAAFTVAISDYCSSQLKRWARFDDWQKIHVVRCTVDETWFQAGRPVDASARTLVSVGRLSAQKGQYLLIDAFAQAVRLGSNLNLLLVGDGELRGMIQQRIDGLGLQDRVRIAGWRTGAQVREHLLDARALLLPSFAEGLPMVLMESMALQRPVIATIIAGIPELVEHGRHGWLITAGSENSLTEAILEVERAPIDLLHSYGAAGPPRVRRFHAVSQEAQKLSRLFESHLDVTSK